MVTEARRIALELGKTTLVKIPCTPEGFKAMKQLKKEGIRFIGTAVYTAMQGFLAAKCGAEYVAPYVVLAEQLLFCIGTLFKRLSQCGCEYFFESFLRIHQLQA